MDDNIHVYIQTKGEVMVKICTRCKSALPVGEFCKNKLMPDGLNGWCKECAAMAKKTLASKRFVGGLYVARITKICNRCKISKLSSEFSVSKHSNDGLQGACKECGQSRSIVRLTEKKVNFVKPEQGDKTCNKCHKTKSVDEFYVSLSTTDYLEGRCKECRLAVMRSRAVDRQSSGACQRCGSLSANGRRVCDKCRRSDREKTALIRSQRQNNGECPTCGRDNPTNYFECGACRVNRVGVNKRRRSKPEHLQYMRAYEKRRMATNVQARLARNMRARLHDALNGNYKVGSAIKNLGCTIQEFKIYLESQFESWMSWDNYGNGPGCWSIDHILALSSVDLTDREQFLRVVHYTNMRPLNHVENMKRYSRDKRETFANNLIIK